MHLICVLTSASCTLMSPPSNSFHLCVHRLVCGLAALLVQVQVPARTGRGRQHPAGWNPTSWTQERTLSQRHHSKSPQDCAPKSGLFRNVLLDCEDVSLWQQTSHVFTTDLTLHHTWTMSTFSIWPPLSSPGHFKQTGPSCWVFKGKSHWLLHVSVDYLVLITCFSLTSLWSSGSFSLTHLSSSIHVIMYFLQTPGLVCGISTGTDRKCDLSFLEDLMVRERPGCRCLVPLMVHWICEEKTVQK